MEQHIITGSGSLAQLVEHVQGRALIVTDLGVLAAGHVERAAAMLKDVMIYDQVRENPTESDVAACAEFAREQNPDILIGLGGGSSLDTAKGTLFLLSGGGKMSDYQGHDRLDSAAQMLPFIAIPTTAGTGSECQSYAVLSRDQSHEKMACGDPRALAKTVILDPELTASMPLKVARITALDALSHALESAVCTKSTSHSRALSFAAFRKIEPVIEAVLQGGATAEERGEMLHGAALAGQAIEASMLGAAHASANPLTARYGIIHGHAVLTMLPTVMSWNAQEVGGIYEDLKPDLISWVEQLRELAELETPAIPHEAIPEIAREAVAQWTAQFNPRRLDVDDFEAIYRDAL